VQKRGIAAPDGGGPPGGGTHVDHGCSRPGPRSRL
jgi:hypothetical protein